MTKEEADALLELAKKVGLPVRGPEANPDRTFKDEHIHIGPIDHIPVKPSCPVK